MAVLIALVGVLFLFFQRTKVGLAMRAVSMNPESSRLAGISVGRTLMIGWGVAALAGALAGMLIAPRLFLDVNFMGAVLIYSFAAATLGGFDSPLGAVVGGWIIGVAENLAGTYVDWIGNDLKILVPLLIILAVLMVRPTGPVRLAGGLESVKRRLRLRRAGRLVTGGWSVRSSSAPTGSASSRWRARYAVAVLGLNLLVGYSGQISLGHGALVRAGRVRQRDPDHRRRLSRASRPCRWPPWCASSPASCSGLPALRLRGLYLAS